MTDRNRAVSTLCVLAVWLLVAALYAQDKAPASYLFEGRMLDRETAVNGQCRFRVELWAQKTGAGERIGSAQIYDVSLEQGNFRILLNQRGEFGPDAFRDRGYWMDLGVQCAGDADFVNFEDRRWVGAATAYELSWWTVDGGGGTSTGGNLELTGTIGQPDAQSSSGGGFSMYGGFWGAPGSGYRIYVPIVSKLP